MASSGNGAQRVQRQRTSLSLRSPMPKLVLLGLSLLAAPRPSRGAVPCSTDAECAQSLHPLSKCVVDHNDDGDGTSDPSSFCSNPYASGCLRAHLGKDRFPRKRVCNSHDNVLLEGLFHEDEDDDDNAVCVEPEFDYPEMRINAANWESSIFFAFLMQILLSEILGVPAVLETGDADNKLSFYDVRSGFTYPSIGYYWEDGEIAADCTDRVAAGLPCGNVMPEVWQGQMKQATEAQLQGRIEIPEGTGMVGKNGWYVPKFAAQADPSLTSYLGLQGDDKRRKLADVFRRPTKWSVYCDEFSKSACSQEDKFAVRAPTSEEVESGLGEKYHVPGLFNGYFGKTHRGDCDRFPNNCTGHIADYPCSWSTLTVGQAYWNNIHIESNGDESESNGYSYGDLLDIWTAANATRSPVIMQWWTPEAHVSWWQGTDAEFVAVQMPPPTEECRKARITNDERCSPDITIRRGRKEGSCDEEAHDLRKILAPLSEATYSTPPAERSPAYEAVKALRVSDLSMEAMLRAWITRGVDKWGFDPREGVCAWAAENIDELEAAVPRGHPRTLIKNWWYTENAALFYVAVAFATIVLVGVVASSAFTIKYRRRSVMRVAQIDFLVIILTGCFLVALAAIVFVLEPSLASCTARPWLITMGYTLGITPLLVKVAAISNLARQAKKMKRVHLSRRSLHGAVAAIAAVVLVYLVVWTAVDPPTRRAVLVLPEAEGTVVMQKVLCASSSGAWTYVAFAWQFLLLVMATVLAFQARQVRQEFNESKSLGSLVYSHFFFAVLRSIVYFIHASGDMAASAQSFITSLLLSLDTIAAIIIYFVPKFINRNQRASSVSGRSVLERASRWGSHGSSVAGMGQSLRNLWLGERTEETGRASSVDEMGMDNRAERRNSTGTNGSAVNFAENDEFKDEEKSGGE